MISPSLPLSFKTCHHCQQPMRLGEPAVYAERAGYDKLWHPACFVCCTCKELLVDMIYFWKKGKLYCGRHYGDSEKPRCAGCDEVSKDVLLYYLLLLLLKSNFWGAYVCVYSWSSVMSTLRLRARTGIWSTFAVLSVIASLLERHMSWKMTNLFASLATWRPMLW